MNYLRINIVSVFAVIMLILSCNEKNVSFSRIEFKIPDHINININDLNGAVKDIKTDSASNFYIVLVLYSYSSGAETISFSGGNDVKTVNGKGKLKGLVKVTDGKNIIRAEFIEGEGESREEMIASLVKEIKLKLLR